MGWYLDGIDLEEHNEEVRHVWDAFHAGKPVRVPVILGITPRIYLLNPEINTQGITFREYSEDPDVMVSVQLASLHYIRHNMLQDAEMGLPADGWAGCVDLQNYYEAAWFGCPVEYRDGQVPDTRPILSDDNKRMLFDRGFPDPFTDGSMGKNWRFYEHMNTNLERYSCAGLPVTGVTPAALGTDGPLTIAASLRGATELCLDLYEDPDYVRELLGFITEATILRIKAFRKALGQEIKPPSLLFADDSIEMLSLEMYREFVLPCHAMLIRELAGEGPHGIHLCGGVDHLMPTLKDELNLNTWDAGFPIDCRRMRQALGPDLLIQTGPPVSLLLHGSPEEVSAECRRILSSGITDGGRFILRDANNLCPCTPVENVAAMYRAAQECGRYARDA